MEAKSLQKPLWAQEFKIDDTLWASLCQQAAKQNCSPLAIALLNGAINENKFLQWERDRSGIASLKSTFFNATPPSEIWGSYKFSECKSDSCLPVGLWEEHVLWAKISSESTTVETQAPRSMSFLAPYSAIKKWFDIWEKSQAETLKPLPEAPAPLDVPAGLKLDLPEVPSVAIAKTLASVPGETATAENIAPKTEAEKALDPFSAPVGLGSALHVDSIDFSSLGVDHGTSTEIKTSTKTVSTAPAAPIASEPNSGVLELDLNFGETEAPTVVEKPAVLPPLPPASPATAKAPQVAPVASPATAKAPAPPVPGAPAAPIAPKIPKPAAPPVSPVQAQPASQIKPQVQAQPQALASAVVNVALDKLDGQMNAAKNQDELASAVIGAWQTNFEKVMIFLHQQENLIFWWHNNKWPTAVKRGDSIKLDTPSVFKIVADTQRAYHGYVSAGPVNDDFFARVNGGNYPDHLTIVPVCAGEKVIAMILGTCSKEQGAQINLITLEDQAKKFSVALAKLMPPALKAS